MTHSKNEQDIDIEFCILCEEEADIYESGMCASCFKKQIGGAYV